MNDLSFAELQIVEFLQHVLEATRLDLTFEIESRLDPLPELTVIFSGPDCEMLTAVNGDLLRSIEHLAAQLGHVEPERRGLVSMDAGMRRRSTDDLSQDTVREYAALLHAMQSLSVSLPIGDRRHDQLKPVSVLANGPDETSLPALEPYNLDSSPAVMPRLAMTTAHHIC